MLTPLALHIYWDSADENMYKYAEAFYGFFLRNPENPLDRYVGLPVHLYPNPPSNEELQIENSVYSVHIFLVDDNMNLSQEWTDFSSRLIKLISKTKKGEHQIFCIAINKDSYGFSNELSKKQYVRFDGIEEERKIRYALIRITHALCRLLYNKDDSDKSTANSAPGAPIKLFLSHAKKDGEVLAKKLRKHIQKFTGLKTFFDANDIAIGQEFSLELERSIEKAMLIAIHSDEYSSREWCRREFLLAKRNNRPILVVNRFQEGEYRSFPYMGNVPHIHFHSEEINIYFLDYIILEALREALKNKYNYLKTKALAHKFSKGVTTTLSYPPELISLLKIEKSSKQQLIVYPEPPLGAEEYELLKEYRPDLTFTTPTLLPLLSKKDKGVKTLEGFNVGISLSETDKSTSSWIQNRALQNLMVEISRYLLVGGTTLIYSGKIDYQAHKGGKEFNFASLLAELVRIYQSDFSGMGKKINRVTNYSAYPLFDLLTKKQRIRLKRLVNFIEVPAPAYLKAAKEHAKVINQRDTFAKKYVIAKSLSKMRNLMMDGKNTQAWIILGGKWTGFQGSMSGVLEEYLCAIKSSKPIFLIGAYGGVAKTIIDTLNGKKPLELTENFYKTEYHSYAHFLNNYNSNKHTRTEEIVDYKKILKLLNSRGQMNNYGLNNGLTKAENQRLFKTKNEDEIIHLLLKGLHKIANL